MQPCLSVEPVQALRVGKRKEEGEEERGVQERNITDWRWKEKKCPCVFSITE